MSIASYRQLTVWQKSFQLAKDVYVMTQLLPKTEQYGMAAQIQRSAVSIPSNIAEGQQRNNRKEYRQFLGIARGSAAELETQVLLVKDIYRLEVENLLMQICEVQKMLFVLIKKLET